MNSLLRKKILSKIDNILKNKLLVNDVNSTPNGLIKVGEKGPEWLFQKVNKS